MYLCFLKGGRLKLHRERPRAPTHASRAPAPHTKHLAWSKQNEPTTCFFSRKPTIQIAPSSAMTNTATENWCYRGGSYSHRSAGSSQPGRLLVGGMAQDPSQDLRRRVEVSSRSHRRHNVPALNPSQGRLVEATASPANAVGKQNLRRRAGAPCIIGPCPIGVKCHFD